VEVQISNIIVDAAGEDSMGAISGGKLSVTGLLRPATLGNSEPRTGLTVFDHGWISLTASDGVTVGAIYPGVLSEPQHVQVIYCVSVRTESYWSMVEIPHRLYSRHAKQDGDEELTVMGMALVRCNEFENAHKRTGLVRWMKASWFEGVDPSEIQIL
jgi:hypothetical protein